MVLRARHCSAPGIDRIVGRSHGRDVFEVPGNSRVDDLGQLLGGNAERDHISRSPLEGQRLEVGRSPS